MTTEKKWLAHYPKEISAHVKEEVRTLQSYLREAAEQYPEKIAIHFMGKEITYGQLYKEALRFAYQLQQLGVEKGDRVAIMLPNTPQSVICYYGALFAGGIVVQTNPLYVEREIGHQMKDSGATVIVCLDLLYPRVEKVRKQTALQHVIVTEIKDYLPFPKNVIYPFVQKREYGNVPKVHTDRHTHSFKQLIKTAQEDVHEPFIDPKEDLALIQYTGGTTGPAKGVMLTHFNLVMNTLQCMEWTYKMKRGEERVLGALPFFHVYGMTVVMNFAIMFISKMIILPKFEPKEVLKTIEKHRVTLFPGAPTMYIGLMNEPSISDYDLSSVEVCLSGAAPLPLEVQQKFEELSGGKLVEGYGLTESSPVALANPIWGTRKEGSIGIPWPNTEAAILSTETMEEAKPGEVGELMIKGPQVMRGYWNRPEETKATFHGDWLLTGDMGYMDEDGYFYIVDRKKDVIIAGGYNIYPREIEEVLFEHEAVQEAAVIGVPDPYRGETVKAFIVLKEGKEVNEKELEAYTRKHLAAYKVPRLFEFKDELPKTMVGKVLRRVLIEEEKNKLKENQIKRLGQ